MARPYEQVTHSPGSPGLGTRGEMFPIAITS